MAIEDFTTYTEVDEDGDITVAADQITVDTMRRDARSYVVKDYGADYFSDFVCQMDIDYIAASGTHGFLGVWGLSNSSYTYQDMLTNAEGCFVGLHFDGTYYNLWLQDISTPAEDHIAWLSAPGQRYLTITRSGSAMTAQIYTDAARTNLEDTLQIVCNPRTYAKQFGVFSCEIGGYIDSIISASVSNLEHVIEVLEDASLDLSAYYQTMIDLSSSLDAIGWNIAFGDRWGAGDLWDPWSRWGYFPMPPSYDLAALLEALAEKREDLAALLQACGFSLADLGALLEATDGVVFKDFGVYLHATDGLVILDAGVRLQAIANIPTFRTITAQKVSSVIHEIEV